MIIDKLPFSVPSDPVVAARIAQINESGGNAFYDYQIPTATILLKQGMGQLTNPGAKPTEEYWLCWISGY